MSYHFNAIFEKGDTYYIGYCVEVPEANGQGTTIEECRNNLIEAVKLVLEDKKREVLNNIPHDAIQEELTVL